MSDTIVIGGEISLTSVMDGEGTVIIECDGEEGTIIQYDSHSLYEGAYEITPSSVSQTIPIANLIASDNITINPIPQQYGLITWNGSFLQIS